MRRLSRLTLPAFLMLSAGTIAQAQTVYPVDRAEILVGSRFDLKVELPERSRSPMFAHGERPDYAASSASLRPISKRKTARTIRADPARCLARQARRLHHQGLRRRASRELSWTVYETGPRKAKNVSC